MTTEGRVGADVFEAIYARDHDPWSYLDSDYERDKYADTLATVPREASTALELGCSIGVFTTLLAGRCDSVLATDFSAAAVAAARERTAGLPGVEVIHAVLPEEIPPGSFDVIICSEVLYYWSEELLRGAIPELERRVSPGGRLLVVGWSGTDPDAPQDAASVRCVLEDSCSLTHSISEDRPGYLLDAWDRA